MDQDKLRSMTGQENYQGGPRLVLNEVLINGDGDIEEVGGTFVHKGGYYRKRIWVDKPQDAKPEDVNLGKEIDVVLLKVRRKLVQRSNDGKIVRSTSEHNTPDDTVAVFEGAEKIFSGTAREAREKYEGLRTVQIVYALLLNETREPELVRLTVKGASLGSDARPKELPSFYQYLGSFGKESIASYYTKLGVALEKGKKNYYTMTFAKAGYVTEAQMPEVVKNLEQVHEYCTKADSRKVEVKPEVEAAVAESYPDEEIDPAAIPF